MERKKYLDTIKFGAILVICVTHFIEMFYPDHFSLWSEMPASLLLYGVSGKLGVAVLGVIMCFISMQSKEENPIRFFLKRYTYFFAAGLLINSICIATGIGDTAFNLRYLLAVSFSLGDQIFPTFWCMRSFLVASCISYINGRYGAKIWVVVTEIVILIMGVWDWTAICLMGSLVFLLLKKEKVKGIVSNIYVKTVLCFFVFFAIKRTESQMTYYMDGIAASVFLMVTECSSLLKRILSAPKALSYLGKTTMAMFLLHPVLFFYVGNALFSTKYFYPSLGVSFVLVLCISFIVLIPASILLQWGFDAFNGFVSISFSTSRISQKTEM